MSPSRRSPIFPLGTPLLPGGVLPVHVFELRYRMMMDDVVHSDVAEFGVVLIERGHEVGGGDTRSNVGTMARVLRHDELEDGRRAVVVVGERRIRVDEWLPDDPYPMAVVSDVIDAPSDVDVDLEQRFDAMIDRFVELLRNVDERFPSPGRREESESIDDYVYRIGATLPLGPVDRQRILEAGGTAERLSRAVEAVADAEAVVRFRLGLTEPER